MTQARQEVTTMRASFAESKVKGRTATALLLGLGVVTAGGCWGKGLPLPMGGGDPPSYGTGGASPYGGAGGRFGGDAGVPNMGTGGFMVPPPDGGTGGAVSC